MIIINKMSNKRLNSEIFKICEDISNALIKYIETNNVDVQDLTKKTGVGMDKFVTGKFSLSQYMKVCYHLDVSPSIILKTVYDERKVIIK